MKKIIKIGICIIFIITSFSYAEIDKKQLEEKYRQGISFYYDKDYAQALVIFKEIQGEAPTYRASQIKRYITRAQTELGKLGVKEKFVVGESEIKEVKIKKEGELEVLSAAAQKTLLDTYQFFSEEKKKYNVSDFDMTGPESTLKLAKEAYDNKEYTEAIRLANKSRLELENIVQKKVEEKKVVSLGEIGETPVTLNLTNADLEQTLKLIYDLTGANIILSKGISGRVTINVKDLPLKKVLNLICEANQLKYLEEDGIIKIMTQEEFNKSAEVIKQQNRRVFKILYGDASSIAKSIRDTYKMDRVIADPRTNSILLDIDDPIQLARIQETISMLDAPISQVLIEAKIIEIRTSTDNMLSIDWLVSSRLVDELNATLTGPKFGDNPAFTPGISNTLPGGFSFGLTNADVNTLISSLATQGDVKLIQAPKITCLNGTNAIISVIQNYPYIIPEYEETYNDQGVRTGTRQTVTVYEENVGTEFEVTPIIQTDRSVFLNLNIYDSRLVEIRRLTAIAAGQRYETEQPIVSLRETNQSVSLYDGQTLVIGGLIQSAEEKNESGIPFLRRIPVLGYLFKKPKYTNTKSELLIFLTPHVITTFKEVEGITAPDIKKGEKEIKPGLLKHF